MNLSGKSIFLFALLIGVLGMTSVGVKAESVIGVEVGDWIEYNAEYTGTPPESRLIKLRYEVQEINGPIVQLYQTSQNADGNQYEGSFQVNIENKTGSNRRLEILEANLNVGTLLFDDEYMGEVKVDRIEIEYFVGSNREVLYLNKWYETGYCWDRQTGFQLMDTFTSEHYTRVLIAEKTNMWEAQISIEPSPTPSLSPSPSSSPTTLPTATPEPEPGLFLHMETLYVIIVVIVVVVAVAGLAVALKKRKSD